MLISALGMVTVALLTVAGAAQAATLTVCSSGCNHTTIQAAVNAASAGDIINVAAGTYTENVNVNKTLTLYGAQAGNDAREGRTDPAAESVVSGGSNIAFKVDGTSGVTIDGFWFTNTAVTPVTMVGGSGHTLVNSVITGNTGDHDLTYSSTGTSPSLFRHNRITDNTNHGIFGTGEAHDVTIEENYFSGHTLSAVHFAPSLGAGSNVTVANNRSVGDSTFLAGTGVNGLTITGNTVTGSGGSGIALLGGFNGVQITDNTITDGASSGISLTDSFGAGPNQNVEILSNTITGNARGVGVGTGGHASILEVHFNRIVDNTTAGVHNDGAVAVDAENNWWGCNTGPGNSGCDAVVQTVPLSVDFDPWLVLGISASPNSVSTGGTSTITADLTKNSDGMDTSGSGTIPDGTPVTFTTDLGSVNPANTETSGGKATSTFTAGSTAGTANIRAIVDGQSVLVQVTVEEPPNACTITGTNQGEVLTGTPGKDVICALGGNDRANGLGGDDVIRGGGGRDRLRDTSGKDKLYGERGKDRIVTKDGQGGDLANGGPKRDEIRKDKGDIGKRR